MKPKFFMLVGLSGSGKSSAAELLSKINNARIFSSDAIRKELYGDENCQNDHHKVFELLHKRVRKALQNEENAIYDATNLSMKRRKAFLESLNNIDCIKYCFVIATPFCDCIQRDSLRKRSVGREVIFRQRQQFQPPYFYEGWDEIIIYTKEPKNNGYFDDILFESKKIEHDNPHHELSIGYHMIEAEKYCAERELLIWSKQIKTSNEIDKKIYKKQGDIWSLSSIVARYHDIGKVFTKTFTNTKGEKTNIAHYYGHQNVSAYEIISHIGSGKIQPIKDIFSCEKDSIEWWLVIAILVCWHMEPFFKVYDSKAWKKFSNIIGKDLEQVIKYFHLADINSG